MAAAPAGAGCFAAPGFGCDFWAGTCTSSGLGSETAGLVCLAARAPGGRLGGEAAAVGGRLGVTGATPGLAARADRDDLGVTHGCPSPGGEGADECGLGGQDALGAEDTGRHRGGEVGEGLGGGEAGLEAEHGAHPGGVQSATEGQEGHLLGREVRAPGLPDGRAEGGDGEPGQRQRGPAEAAYGLGEGHDPVAGHVEGAGHVGDRGVLEHVEGVLLVQELQPRVEAEDRGDHREPEVAGHRRGDPWTDHVGDPQRGHRDVGTPAAEAAGVGLDLGDVLGEAARGEALGVHALGEHGRVAVGGAVDRGAGLQHQLAYVGSLLARREQLHRPDDVELLHRGAATGRSRGRGDAGVHDGVDALAHDHLRDHGVADVSAHEVGASEVATRRHRVDADDALDHRRLRQLRREATPEIAGNAGDEDNLTHDWSLGGCAYLPRRRRCTRVFFSSLRCFFFAMRLRRFLMTEPTFDLSVRCAQAGT